MPFDLGAVGYCILWRENISKMRDPNVWRHFLEYRYNWPFASCQHGLHGAYFHHSRGYGRAVNVFHKKIWLWPPTSSFMSSFTRQQIKFFVVPYTLVAKNTYLRKGITPNEHFPDVWCIVKILATELQARRWYSCCLVMWILVSIRQSAFLVVSWALVGTESYLANGISPKELHGMIWLIVEVLDTELQEWRSFPLTVPLWILVGIRQSATFPVPKTLVAKNSYLPDQISPNECCPKILLIVKVLDTKGQPWRLSSLTFKKGIRESTWKFSFFVVSYTLVAKNTYIPDWIIPNELRV